MNALTTIFRRAHDLATLNALSRGTAIEALGIEFTAVGPDHVVATMPVDARTIQPYGLLHGGASVVLAETLGSSAGNLCVDEGRVCVGLEIIRGRLGPQPVRGEPTADRLSSELDYAMRLLRGGVTVERPL